MNIAERWQAIALAVLVFSLLAFLSRSYPSIDSFEYASTLQAVQEGLAESTSFYMISSYLVPLTSFELFAPLLGALAIFLIYLALRARFDSIPALIAAALLATSAGFTAFSSAGIFTPLALSFSLFALGAYALLNSQQTRNPARAAFGALTLLAAAFISPSSLIPSGVLTLSLGIQAAHDLLAKRKTCIATPALALAATLAGLALAGMPELAAEPTIQIALLNSFALLPLALPGTLIALIMAYKGESGVHATAASLGLLSLISAPYSTFGALFGMAFACAYGLKWASYEAKEEKNEMAFAG
ncbi:hypothetical protein DRN67_03755, partial [Candidatus Micrarchaeota archaeon]